MIHLSPAAVSEIKRLRSKQQPNSLFRLAVKSGGCSGLYYEMSFEQTVKPGDRIYESSGISMIVDSESWNYINGLRLDYSEDLMGGAFRFHNPQANSICGCGNSFAIAQELVVSSD